MHENKKHWDTFLRCYVYWSTWQNGRAEVVPGYVSKFRAWRPIQQRPRDGTIIRHKTGALRNVS